MLPDDCSACHANISRTKALSPHALLECTICHLTPKEHKSQPRRVEAGKPISRADCAKCHDKSAAGGKYEVPRIDANNHGENYLCWQCHYPHFPEAK
jgi:protein-arginine kinase activator protein McsA